MPTVTDNDNNDDYDDDGDDDQMMMMMAWGLNELTPADAILRDCSMQRHIP